MAGMDFRNASTRVRAMVAAKKPQDLQKSSLTPDQLRDNIVAESAAHSERFKAVRRKQPVIDYELEMPDGTKEAKQYTWESFPEMMNDVARASFSYDEPEVMGPHQVRPSHMLNREIMAQNLISEGMRESRPYTRGNELESLFNAMAQAKDLEESARTRLAEHIARSEEMREQEDDIRDADQMMDDLRKRARQQVQQGGQVDDPTRRQIKQQVKRRQQARGALQGLLQQQAQSNMVAQAISAANSAAQAGADAVEAINQLPGVGGGHSHNLTPDQQLELAEKWSANTDLRRIAQMLGRMYRDMRFKRQTRMKNVPIEPVGVTTGNDLELLLPTEAARALQRDKFSKFTFVKDFVGRSLLQYEMSGKIPAGKGPIICVTDGSGSMSGEPFIWASSLALCLMTIAHREKRDFAGVEFGSAGQMKSWFFPKSPAPDPNEVLDYASHFWAGGTSTVTGMAEALRIVEEVPEFKTADIILIGDGYDTFGAKDQAIRAACRDKQVRIHGISILAPNNVYLEQMCETVVDVQDLAGSNSATDQIATNIT